MSYHATYSEYKKDLGTQQEMLSVLKNAREFISDSIVGSHQTPLIQNSLRENLLQRMDNLIFKLSERSEKI
jgi:hypothetical protein